MATGILTAGNHRLVALGADIQPTHCGVMVSLQFRVAASDTLNPGTLVELPLLIEKKPCGCLTPYGEYTVVYLAQYVRQLTIGFGCADDPDVFMNRHLRGQHHMIDCSVETMPEWRPVRHHNEGGTVTEDAPS